MTSNSRPGHLSTAHLFNNPLHSDITLTFATTTLHLHRLILAAHSGLLDRLIQQDITETATLGSVSPATGFTFLPLELRQWEPEALFQTFRYLYTGTVEVNDEQWRDLLPELGFQGSKFRVSGLPALALELFQERVERGAGLGRERVAKLVLYIREMLMEDSGWAAYRRELETRWMAELLECSWFRFMVQRERSLLLYYETWLAGSEGRGLDGQRLYDLAFSSEGPGEDEEARVEWVKRRREKRKREREDEGVREGDGVVKVEGVDGSSDKGEVEHDGEVEHEAGSEPELPAGSVRVVEGSLALRERHKPLKGILKKRKFVPTAFE